MDKYIGLDMDCKKTVGYTIIPGKKESSATLGPDIESIRRYFRQERQGGYRIHAAFEISGQAGFLYDQLLEDVDSLHVVNPTKMTWIYRTAKKNDRIDARKMAVLLSIGELPEVYMPSKEVRQWKVVRYCPGLRAFYERVMAGQQSRKKIAIIALTRKLLCIMRAMLMTGELFNEKLVQEVLKAA